MATPYPDLRTFTTKDYGNRVGIFRIMSALDKFKLKASVCLNSDLIGRAPPLMNELKQRDWEIIASARNMNDILHEGLSVETESALIAQTTEAIKQETGKAPQGWLSPARSESFATPSLLAKAGYRYVCDWVNDDMPYEMTTDNGPLYAMPHTYELEDKHVLLNLGQREEVYIEQILAAYDRLNQEAENHGGRILHIALTPYIIGQPFRIWALIEALQRLMEKDSIWNATGADILGAWMKSQKAA